MTVLEVVDVDEALANVTEKLATAKGKEAGNGYMEPSCNYPNAHLRSSRAQAMRTEEL